jgi:hypothetical protein
MKHVRSWAIALVVVVAAAGHALGHTGGSSGYAAISAERSSVHYRLTLWPAALPAEVGEVLRQARAGKAASQARVIGFVRDKVSVIAQGKRCSAGPGSLVTGTQAGPDNVTIAVDFACGSDVRALVIRDDLFDVLGSDYHTLARIDLAGRTVQFAFSPETRETRVEADAAGGRGLGSFVLLGIEHILTGYDHLLFLLGLLLRGGSWLTLAKIVTAFTLAHSVTLALAALDIVMLPDRLVEAVIALSIAFVAAENIFLKPVVSRRWVVSFCFGLVHGFGFSSALRELDLPTHGLVLALFGFNIGVELGQGLVVAVALPLLALIRRAGWEQRMVWSSSLAILVVGVVLFVERTFF